MWGAASANTAYEQLGGGERRADSVGLARPVHVLPHGADVSEIVNIVVIAVVDAQRPDPPDVL